MVYNVYIKIKGVLNMTKKRTTITLSLNEIEQIEVAEVLTAYRKAIDPNAYIDGVFPDSVMLKRMLMMLAYGVRSGQVDFDDMLNKLIEGAKDGK